MRKIYQIDGKQTGVLSIGERSAIDEIAICINQGDREVQILIKEKEFMELCDLKYRVEFHKPKQPESEITTEHQLKAV